VSSKYLDGFFTIDLTSQDAEVLGGQDPTQFTVTYYTSQADADAGTNPSFTPANKAQQIRKRCTLE
jgi:hypothetical protein